MERDLASDNSTRHLAPVKPGDTVATLIFWLIAGSIGLFIGGISIGGFLTEFDGSNHRMWFLLGIGVAFLGLTFAGIRQCLRTVTNTEKRKDAA